MKFIYFGYNCLSISTVSLPIVRGLARCISNKWWSSRGLVKRCMKSSLTPLQKCGQLLWCVGYLTLKAGKQFWRHDKTVNEDITQLHPNLRSKFESEFLQLQFLMYSFQSTKVCWSPYLIVIYQGSVPPNLITPQTCFPVRQTLWSSRITLLLLHHEFWPFGLGHFGQIAGDLIHLH